jgi:hypothetical protein
MTGKYFPSFTKKHNIDTEYKSLSSLSLSLSLSLSQISLLEQLKHISLPGTIEAYFFYFR